jgi:flagellar protein FlaH
MVTAMPEDEEIEEEPVQEEETARKDIISTGHTEIDKKLGGGIPIGSLVLIEGESDAGKSVLCQQIMWGSLNSNFKVLLYTAENTVRSLITQMDSLGMDILDQVLMGWFKIYYMKLAKLKFNDPRNSFQVILETMEYHSDCDLVIVDSLTPIVTPANAQEALVYFERCKALCDKGRTIINVTHTYAFDHDFLIRVRSVCDSHFRLLIEKVGDKLVKTLEVSKIRGAQQNTGNILTFDVEPEVGLKIMPISKAKA